MDIRTRMIGVLARIDTQLARVAADEAGCGLSRRVRTAAEVPSEEGAGNGRAIPKGHSYNPTALKPLAKMLWAMSVSLGHALTAYRQFTRLKSSAISPDGKLGGRGYVMDVRQIRQQLYAACEALSTISDTIHDEITGPHWKPKLAQLAKGEAEDVRRYVDEAEEALEDAEESEADLPDPEGESKPAPWSKDKGDKDPGLASKLPDGGDPETNEVPETSSPTKADKTASTSKKANSSLPVTTLPGPRVEHLDRGNEPGPYGSWNRGEEPSQNTYDRRREYDYPHDGDNDLSGKSATSGVPGALTDNTRTDANDFGLGGGNNPSTGGGLEHSPAPASGKGVWGPSAELPGDVDGTPDRGRGSEDTMEVALEGRNAMGLKPLRGRPQHMVLLDDANSWVPNDDVGGAVFSASKTAPPLRGRNHLCVIFDDLSSWAPNKTASMLPNDNLEPVARSDYFQGPKGNIVSETSEVAESGMPGDDMAAPGSNALPGVRGPAVVYESDTSTPYARWEDSFHDNRREDPQQYQNSRPRSAKT